MKRSQVFVTSALALSLGIAGLMPTVSTYADGSTACDAGDKSVNVAADATFASTIDNLNAAEPGSVEITTDADGKTVYTLKQNICVSGTAAVAEKGMVVSGNIILDLSGHHIATDDADARLINVGKKDGDLQSSIAIKGAGTVAASKGIPVRVYGGTAAGKVQNAVDLSNKAVLDGDVYGLMIGANSNNSAHDVTVTASDSTIKGAQGGMYVNGNAQDGDVNISIENGSTVSGGTDSGIYAAGKAEWIIDNSTVTGYTGISAKAGTFTLNNANVTGNGAKQTPDPANSNGMGETGAAIAIESNPSYAGGVNMTINGGTYTSAHNSTFLNYQNGNYTGDGEIENLTVNYGQFNSAPGEPVFAGFDNGKAAENTLVAGGTFSSNTGIDQFLPAGSELSQDANGNFIVVRPNGMGSNAEQGNANSNQTSAEQDTDQAAKAADAPETGASVKGEASAKSSATSIMAKIATAITMAGIGVFYARRRAEQRKHNA